MRIAYMSDLHLEFEPPVSTMAGWDGLTRARAALSGHPQRGPLVKGVIGSDLVVLAGDVDVGLGGMAYAEQLADYVDCPVIYVAGNHEYYGHDIDHLRADLRRAAWASQGRVIFLDRDSVRLWLGGHPLLVHGCTLWTDYAIHAAPEDAMVRASYSLNDHRRISRDYGWFTPSQAREEHCLSRDWLAEQLASSDPDGSDLEPARRLVVTHHAPLPTKMQGRPEEMAPCYMSDMLGLISQRQPDLWLHGHTHHRHTTTVGRTVVASAPRGYLGSQPDALDFSCGFFDL